MKPIVSSDSKPALESISVPIHIHTKVTEGKIYRPHMQVLSAIIDYLYTDESRYSYKHIYLKNYIHSFNKDNNLELEITLMYNLGI